MFLKRSETMIARNLCHMKALPRQAGGNLPIGWDDKLLTRGAQTFFAQPVSALSVKSTSMRKFFFAFAAVIAATSASANDQAVPQSFHVAQLQGPNVIRAPRVAEPQRQAQRNPRHQEWDQEAAAPEQPQQPEAAPHVQQVQYYQQQVHPYERPHRYQQRHPQQQQYYAPQPRGNLGGGFIEYLVTGNGQQRYEPQAQPEPRYYHAPQAQQRYDRRPMQYPRHAAPYYEDQPQRPARVARTDPQEQPRQNRFDPRFEPTEVAYETKEPVGTIVIDTRTRFLYLVQPNGRALRYGVGVGRPGFSWKGVKTVSAMKEWPDWRPPAEMRLRQPYLPVHMPGGPNNPLGARALYLGSSLYRIHGSNEPHTIGSAVSSGCFRMRNQDVIDLYNRVRVGARVVVL
jgi:lipoprotein-anchoring transpeptidase ErfK/SrfK